MDARAIYGIRDAKGLTTNEKVFLYTVASHNDGMYATHDKNYKAMGLSKATYYRVRESLMTKKLVAVQRLMDAPTVYTVDKTVLDGWNESLSETSQSHSETDESLCETPESHCAETKVNLKGNSKENLKDNISVVADAPTHSVADAPSSLEIKENKEDQETEEPKELTPWPESQSETEQIQRFIALREARKQQIKTGPVEPALTKTGELNW